MATAVKLATVKIQTTILASAGTPTATNVLKWTPIKSRDACKNSEAGNSMEGGQLQRDNRSITASTLEGRPAAARMPERRLINEITSNQPTNHVFLRKFGNVVRTAKNS